MLYKKGTLFDILQNGILVILISECVVLNSAPTLTRQGYWVSGSMVESLGHWSNRI